MPHPFNKLVALIVEDRPEMVMIWSRYLEPLDFQIKTASTLADAKILAKEIPPPDLLLLDLRLTDSERENTIASIKDLVSANPDCAVIVLSGFLTPALNELAIKQGAHQALEKISIERAADLWKHITSFLDKAPLEVQNKMSRTAKLIEKLSKALLF